MTGAVCLRPFFMICNRSVFEEQTAQLTGMVKNCIINHHRSVFEEQIVQLTGAKILKLSVKGGSSVLTQYSFQNIIHN